MAVFSLKGSEEHYLALSDPPKRFDIDSPATNVFFDDTNGEVFAVRSGGVTGVTVNGMDDFLSTSFRMEDRGPIVSMKFSPDHRILAIQRNRENQLATVEFFNFKDLVPTNVEYTYTCKWKSAKVLGFVWPKANEIAFITDHGIELLQVYPDKKQLKSLKNTSFSGAWFLWCAESGILVLAGNNGALLQPFSLNSSTITKLQKLELESAKPVVERDVFVVRVSGTTCCAVFTHRGQGHGLAAPTEICLLPVSGTSVSGRHLLRTGLAGRFAVSVIDHLLVVHHQSSQTSQIFDIMEDIKPDNNVIVHAPIVNGHSIKQATLEQQPCPMYSSNWVVFQPDYVIDARLGCLWKVQLVPSGLAYSVPKDEISKIVGVLLRRTNGKNTLYQMLNQLVSEAGTYLAELSKVFDEINLVYRKWADLEVARNIAGNVPDVVGKRGTFPVLISQADMCQHVLGQRLDDKYIVQVVTAYIASVKRNNLLVSASLSELAIRCQVIGGHGARLAAAARRGALPDSRQTACTLLALRRVHPAAIQLALDMMWRLQAYDDIIEVLLNWSEPVTAVGVARQARGTVWNALSARKLLAASKSNPPAFAAIYRALLQRQQNQTDKQFLKAEQCDTYVELYKKITSE